MLSGDGVGDNADDLILVRIDEVSIWDTLSIITSKMLPVEMSIPQTRPSSPTALARSTSACPVPKPISSALSP